MLTFSELLKRFEQITVDDFLNHMATLGSLNDSIMIPGFKNRQVYIWEISHSGLGPILAKHVGCVFFGGPPSSKRTYKGTLLSVLIDRNLTLQFK